MFICMIFVFACVVAFFLTIVFEVPLVACEKVLFKWIDKGTAMVKGNKKQ